MSTDTDPQIEESFSDVCAERAALPFQPVAVSHFLSPPEDPAVCHDVTGSLEACYSSLRTKSGWIQHPSDVCYTCVANATQKGLSCLLNKMIIFYFDGLVCMFF